MGSAAPDFSLPDAKGQAHSLSQYKGKYVVLEWFNPECPFVKKHYGTDNMQKLQKEYTRQGCGLVDHRFQCAWYGRQFDAGTGPEGRNAPGRRSRLRCFSIRTAKWVALMAPRTRQTW